MLNMFDLDTPIKRKYDQLSDGTEDLFKLVSDLVYQYTQEGYSMELMLYEISHIVYTSEFNIFDSKEECVECVEMIVTYL